MDRSRKIAQDLTMPYVHQVLVTLACVITFASCVQPLGNYTLWHEISAQQTFEHQSSDQQTSRHQTLQFDTFKHKSFEHVFSSHFFKHKTLGHQSLKQDNLRHQPSGNQKLEPKTLGDETSGQQGSRKKKSTGCTAPLLLPAKPFFVVWNHPTASCRAHGIDLGFDKWGIVDNNHDSFIGEEIVLFYKLGHIPRYSGSTPYYGGIPQLGNLSNHLQQVNLDINNNIPSPTFSGLSVVDFEAWRPLFDLNFDSLKIYKQKSIELAKQKFPLYNQSQILREATKEFEEAAKSFLETTLQQASVVRPGGRWGYYGYPRCWDAYCNTSSVTVNNRLSWIYNISTGLYPSIYFLRGESRASRATRIHNIIRETLRVKATWTSQDAVILPYSLCQDNSFDLFNETDLSYSIMKPADIGSSGVILWGSSNYMQAKNECLILRDYINTTLGPFVLNVTSFFANCSQQLCEGHGRCVRTDYEQYYQHYLKKRGDSRCLIPDDVLGRKNKKLMTKTNKSHANYIFRYHHEQPTHHSGMNPSVLMVDKRELLSSDFDDYVCKCFAGWSGTHCEHPATE